MKSLLTPTTVLLYHVTFVVVTCHTQGLHGHDRNPSLETVTSLYHIVSEDNYEHNDDVVVQYSNLHHPIRTAETNLYKPTREAVTEPPSYICPSTCSCTEVEVNCSYKGLTAIPKLPTEVQYVYFQGNQLGHIYCSSFDYLPRLRRLDISDNPLEPLPHCTLKVPGPVSYLAMSGCGIKHVPADFLNGFSGLRELDLSRNKISTIAHGLFNHLGRLEYLNLYRNRLSKLESGTFLGLESLRFLSLQQNLLSYREDIFAHGAFIGLNFLETLHLHGNERRKSPQIVYPHRALSQLPWLQNLRLDGYSNRPLGPGFASLINLTHLDFSPLDDPGKDAYCDMSDSIPGNFFANLNTSKLLHLSLSSCSIFNISQGVFKHLPTLYSLDLSKNDYFYFNQFETFSKGLENTAITILNINNICPVVRAPQNMQHVPQTAFKHLKKTKLKVLRFESNSIIDMDQAAFSYLPRTIEHISFYNNDITDNLFLLPTFYFLNLKTLNVSRQWHFGKYQPPRPEYLRTVPNINKLVVTTSTTASVNGSRHFSRRYVPLYPRRYIPLYPMCRQSYPRELDFCGDTYVCSIPLPKYLEVLGASDLNYYGNVPKVQFLNNKVLKRIDFASNNAKCISGPIQGLASLEYLDLSNNFCFRLNPIAFEKLHTLRTLLLHNNFLAEPLANDTEGVVFSDLTSLQHLVLKSNVIRDLPAKLFLNNPNLKTLDLSDNALWRFAPSLMNAAHLQTLDLSFNSLEGLSRDTCNQLNEIKSNSVDLRVFIRGNHFTCTCANFHFLLLLIQQPDIFGDLGHFSCQLDNGDRLTYETLKSYIPILAKKCLGPKIFAISLTTFLAMLAGLLIFSIYYYKRWQWTYLYYVGMSRLHIGSTLVSYRPMAQVFLTYDLDNLACHHLVHRIFRPRLAEAGITYILGEEDFEAGPVEPSIIGAVVSTHKTLVLFSADIFQDYHRVWEVNLAIMHELHMRRPVVVPVVLLRHGKCFGADLEIELRPLAPFHQELYSEFDDYYDYDDDDDDDDHRGLVRDRRMGFDIIQDGYAASRGETLQDLLEEFPPEISAYLTGQLHRCIFYDGGSEDFWDQLHHALLTDT